MGKKLVGANSVEEYICQASGKFYADGSMILTPGAKDKLRDKGITIEYGTMPEVAETTQQADAPAAEACAEKPADACQSDDEKLMLTVVEMLTTKFDITDPEQIISICSQVVKTIKENK